MEDAEQSLLNIKKNKEMEVSGRILKMMEPRSGVSAKTGNPWATQEMVIEYFEDKNQRYADRAVVTVSGVENVKQSDLKEGDEVVVGFGHSARFYEGRWYNELRVYKIDKVKGSVEVKDKDAGGKTTSAPSQDEGLVKPSNADNNNGDDLPF